MTGSARFREAMGRFASGVTVVTALDGAGLPIGCTISAFSSLSLTPPLVLFCVGRDRFSHDDLTGSARFAVNVLAESQADLALSFARFDPERFQRNAWRPGKHGVPLFTGCIAAVECDTLRAIDGGDHSIVLGEVTEVHLAEGEPLIYSRGAFGGFLGASAPGFVSAPAGAESPPEWLLSAPW
jgi:flavin reductase (DIM6/NTAB) family NADH-FMN oxidoreductase RutF